LLPGKPLPQIPTGVLAAVFFKIEKVLDTFTCAPMYSLAYPWRFLDSIDLENYDKQMKNICQYTEGCIFGWKMKVKICTTKVLHA
jgi:hypothetical protein